MNLGWHGSPDLCIAHTGREPRATLVAALPRYAIRGKESISPFSCGVRGQGGFILGSAIRRFSVVGARSCRALGIGRSPSTLLGALTHSTPPVRQAQGPERSRGTQGHPEPVERMRLSNGQVCLPMRRNRISSRRMNPPWVGGCESDMVFLSPFAPFRHLQGVIPVKW
jgi:hypothetical protein